MYKLIDLLCFAIIQSLNGFRYEMLEIFSTKYYIFSLYLRHRLLCIIVYFIFVCFTFFTDKTISICSVILTYIKTTAHLIEGMFRIMLRGVRRPSYVLFSHSKYQFY
jgi:hypothetical protein